MMSPSRRAALLASLLSLSVSTHAHAQAVEAPPPPTPAQQTEAAPAQTPADASPAQVQHGSRGITAVAPATRRDTRPTSRGARAELASVQGLIGAVAGAELCGMAECDQARAWAGVMLLGAGAGVTFSLLATRDGIPHGRAQAVNAGGIFGTWLGVGSILALGRSEPSPQAATGTLLAGQAIGTGLALLADNAFTLTSGEVSLANSGALWTGVTSLLALGAIAPDNDDDEVRRRFSGTTLLTTSLALWGGAYLARRDHVSRGRALMVDLGAITGGGMLPLIGWFVRSDDLQAEAALWSSMAGVLAGAGTAYVLTRSWDAPEVPNLSMSFCPTQGGGVAQLSLRL